MKFDNLSKIFIGILSFLLLAIAINAFVTPDYFPPMVVGNTYVNGVETDTVSPGINLTFMGVATDNFESDSGVDYIRLLTSTNAEIARTNCNGAGSCELNFEGYFNTIGTYDFTFEARDLAGNRATYDVRVYVINNICEAEIISPLDGGWSWLGFPVLFNANVWDEEDGTDLTISWVSSQTGVFGNQINFVYSDLVEGQHTISLIATDSYGASCYDEISFYVSNNTAPTVQIVEPNDLTGYYFDCDVSIDFLAEAFDLEGQTISFLWISNIDGDFGNSASLSYDDLTCGANHTITVVATDSLGASSSDSIQIEIGPYINPPPFVEIILPDGSETFVDACSQIYFEANATDSNGYIVSYVWELNGIPQGISVNNFTIYASSLGAGTHTVSVTAVDNEGAQASDSTTFEILAHTAPTVTLLSPFGTFGEYEAIYFDASVTSTDAICFCGDDDYHWRWEIDGNSEPISNLRNFTINRAIDYMSIGFHNVRVYATETCFANPYNFESSDETTIEIIDMPNQPPVINNIIFYDENNNSVTQIKEWTEIWFEADATDPEHGTNMIYTWTIKNNLTGITLFTETLDNETEWRISYPYLDDGTYIVSLTVTDKGDVEFNGPYYHAAFERILIVVQNQAPIVNIIAPTILDYMNTMEYCSLNFDMTATDPDGDVVSSYLWTLVYPDSTTKTIENLKSFTKTANEISTQYGEHVIIASATDNAYEQKTGQDSFVLNILQNQAPIPNITLPTETDFLPGEMITFNAELIGGDDDAICGVCTSADYTWEWIDLTTGIFLADTSSFQTDALSIGEHVIIVEVTDCYGASSIDVITIMIASHDAAASNLVIGKPTIFLYDIVPVTADISNLGNVEDTISVILSYNGFDLETKQVILNPGDSQPVSFNWNADSWVGATRTLSIRAVVANDVNASNNVVSESVRIWSFVQDNFMSLGPNLAYLNNGTTQTVYFDFITSVTGFVLENVPVSLSVSGNCTLVSAADSVINPFNTSTTNSNSWQISSSGVGICTMTSQIGTNSLDRVTQEWILEVKA